MMKLELTNEWDKVFPKSEKVNHRKVNFHNRYGITLAADLYEPKNAEKKLLNSNGGWNVIGCMSFMNQPILQYSNEIRSAVLIMHGEKAHS